jgi:FHS family L-fucose permease-like MFS transporter
MNSPLANRNYKQAIIIVSILFFTFGFITWINGSLIQFLKIACELNSDVEAFFVTFAFYISYFFLALPSAGILRKIGYKNGMAMGLVVIGIGCLIFLPAAANRNFGLFLSGLFVQGAGLSLLQTASNPYISIAGPIESAAKRISIMGICNKAAGILAPLILSAILLKDATAIEIKIEATTDIIQRSFLLDQLAGRIFVPYMLIAAALFLLGGFIKISSLPQIDAENSSPPNNEPRGKKTVFRFPHLLLGVLCIFLYVGAEVMAGDAIGLYGKAMGMPLDDTKNFTTYTLEAMLIGYIAGIFTIPKYLSQQLALKISAVLGLVLTVCIFFSSGYTAIIFIALLGLANALMWPAIFPLAITGLGPLLNTGSALLVMGISGGAIVPLIYALLKENPIGLNNSLAFFITMFPSYLFIFYYAVAGHKAGMKINKVE